MRHVLLLRGINVGASRRVPMAQLRTLLDEGGYGDVATHLQSGNIVLSSAQKPRAVAAAVGELISERFGFEVPVLARSAGELSAVIDHDPVRGAAQDPKRYQVTFLERAPTEAVMARLHEATASSERVAVHGRELYTWHPDGIARSKLALRLTASELGVSATSRNWRTVIALRDLAAPASD